MAGRGRAGTINIPLCARREIGAAIGAIQDIADKYGISLSAVRSSRDFVRRELAGEIYDEKSRLWRIQCSKR